MKATKYKTQRHTRFNTDTLNALKTFRFNVCSFAASQEYPDINGYYNSQKIDKILIIYMLAVSMYRKDNARNTTAE